MKKSPRSLDHAVAVGCLALLSVATMTQVSAQTAAPAALEVPAKTIPVPTDVSPQLQKVIGAPLRSNWNIQPKTGEEWKPVADAGAAALVKNVPGMLERLKVKVEKTTIDGVRAYIVTPETIAPENRNRQLIHMHGGCYVLNPGDAGLPEAIFMAGFGHIKVISVDYRMPPEAYFPAALDDGIEDHGRKEHGDLRDLGRRLIDARNGAEGEGARASVARGHRAGNADVGCHQDRRHLPNQRDAGQRAGFPRRLL